MDALDNILDNIVGAVHNLEHIHHGLLKYEDVKQNGPFEGYHQFTIIKNDGLLFIHPKDIAQYLII